MYESNPKSFESAMVDILTSYLENHPDQATELAEFMKKQSPQSKSYNIKTGDITKSNFIVGDGNKINRDK